MTQPTYFEVFDTAIGPLTIVVNEEGAITDLYTSDAAAAMSARKGCVPSTGRAEEPKRQLREYAEGRLKEFDLNLEPNGSDFQKSVWGQLVEIPYGETRTYGQLALMLGNKNASRAVGRANATNPISIIVPCHRVIGTSGELTGYAGGLAMKQRLLELEGVLRPTLFDSTDLES